MGVITLGTSFTIEEDLQIVESINEDRLLYREVAEALGRSSSSISGRVSHLKRNGIIITPARKKVGANASIEKPTVELDTGKDIVTGVAVTLAILLAGYELYRYFG